MKICGVEGCGLPHLAKGLCSRHYGRANYKKKPSGRGPLADRFWAKVIRTENCWGWDGTISRPGGYGLIWGGSDVGKPLGAHRVSYEIHNGPIPDGFVVMHYCDTPSCTNPAHLGLGTDRTNSDDKVSKARHSFGTARHNAKLTDEDIRSIRAAGESTSNPELARRYGVVASVIWNIRKGKTWRHIK